MPGTVTVACKLPSGLQLRLQQAVVVNEPVMAGGYKEITYHRHVGPATTINGFAQAARHGLPVSGGYALTHNVDKDFFDRWMEQNADHPAVEGGFIFAHEKANSVESYIRERKAEMSGFEPTDTSNLPIEFKRSIKTAEVV